MAEPVPQVDVAEAARRLSEASDARPILVDVRERNEHAEKRVPGSVLVPLSGLQSEYEGLPADRPLLVMCAAGRRSLVAAEFLRRNGYTDVSNVAGGIIEWERQGLPVETDGG